MSNTAQAEAAAEMCSFLGGGFLLKDAALRLYVSVSPRFLNPWYKKKITMAENTAGMLMGCELPRNKVVFG